MTYPYNRGMSPTALRELVAVRAGHWRTLADDAGVPYKWLFAFGTGKVTGPFAYLDRVEAYFVRERDRRQLGSTD